MSGIGMDTGVKKRARSTVERTRVTWEKAHALLGGHPRLPKVVGNASTTWAVDEGSGFVVCPRGAGSRACEANPRGALTAHRHAFIHAEPETRNQSTLTTTFTLPSTAAVSM
jgi:hypothetical protein